MTVTGDIRTLPEGAELPYEQPLWNVLDAIFLSVYICQVFW
jgi:hypothetical protein